ncbi:hypothetical protein ACQPZX_12740 [Actinoplanes sp. CA-142083]|uniref:hypothetical protein n=1 Tax=Actinoplanes sp. CA-142083 TaxID=3239903 RepID=UPI003D935A64
MRTRLLTVAVGIAAVVAGTGAAAAPPTSPLPSTLARPAADHPEVRGARAPIRGTVAGSTGVAGAAATRFESLTRQRVAAQEFHTAWGTAFSQPQAKGIRATHSVLTGAGTTTRGGEYIYSPTSLSPGGACIEMTTAYTPSGPLLWAWDWCGGNAGVGKAVSIGSSFLATYTTTVNGLPAYSFEVSQTNASTNAWTSYLYNFSTHAYETFYSSSGSYDLGETWFGWDMFEIYSTINPSTGAGYYCAGMAGKSFDASSISVKLNGAWQTATPSNSYSYGNPPPSGSSFQCPKLSFAMNSPNNWWSARIAS